MSVRLYPDLSTVSRLTTAGVAAAIPTKGGQAHTVQSWREAGKPLGAFQAAIKTVFTVKCDDVHVAKKYVPITAFSNTLQLMSEGLSLAERVAFFEEALTELWSDTSLDNPKKAQVDLIIRHALADRLIFIGATQMETAFEKTGALLPDKDVSDLVQKIAKQTEGAEVAKATFLAAFGSKEKIGIEIHRLVAEIKDLIAKPDDVEYAQLPRLYKQYQTLAHVYGRLTGVRFASLPGALPTDVGALPTPAELLILAIRIKAKPEAELLKDARAYVEKNKQSTTFINCLHLGLYEEAAKAQITIEDWDLQWAEYHAFDSLERFACALERCVKEKKA